MRARRRVLGLVVALAVAACGGSSGGPADAAVSPDAAPPADAGPADAAAGDTLGDAPTVDGATTADGAGTSCDAGATWTTLTRLTALELHDLLDAEDPLLVNVHIPYAGEIPGTDTHIPYTDVDAIEAYVGADRCAEIVVYCLTGPMSVSAGNALVARGYLRVRDLLGGMTAWQGAGYPLDP